MAPLGLSLLAWALPPSVWAQANQERCFRTPVVHGWHCEPAAQPGDCDGDGFPDDRDWCPDSIIDPTVVLFEEDSGIRNVFFGNGCTLADLLADCTVNAANPGDFVSCAARLAGDLTRSGALTGEEAGALITFVAGLGLLFDVSPPRIPWRLVDQALRDVVSAKDVDEEALPKWRV